LQKVPKTFSSPEEYISIFEPLLMEEILSQLERGKEENGIPILKVAQRSEERLTFA
jgi:hypothetical protein